MRRGALRAAAILLVVLVMAAGLRAAGVVKWERCADGLDVGNGAGVVDLAAGGEAEARVYAVVDGVGLFVSDDMGGTWRRLGGEVADDVSCVAVMPGDGERVYAGRKSGQGLWSSADGGATWTQVATAAQGLASDEVSSICIGRGDANVMLLGHKAGSAISASTDGGKTWTASDFGIKEGISDQMVFAVDARRWLVASRGGDMQQQTKAMVITADGGQTWSAPGGETADYFRGPLPVVQVGEMFFSTRHHGTNKSEDAGKTWKYKMESHTRVIGSAGEVLFREGDRRFIRGTQDRILNVELSENMGQSWVPANGDLLEVVPAELKPLLIVPAQQDPFAHIRLANAWAATPAGKDVYLSLGKAGLYHGKLMWGKNGPRLAGAEATPLGLPEGHPDPVVTVQAMASRKWSPVKRVYADLSGFGLGEMQLFDDGSHVDGAAKDKCYANTFEVPEGAPVGSRTIGIIAEDEQGNTSSTSTTFDVVSRDDRLIVFNGEQFAGGLSWMTPGALNSFSAQANESHSGKIALEMHCEGPGSIGGGWNWHGFYPAQAGDDIRKYANLSFWVKYEVYEGDASGNLEVSLTSNNEGATGAVNLHEYCATLADGEWHEVTIPLEHLYEGRGTQGAKQFDPSKTWMLNVNGWAAGDRSFSVFIDDIGFDNRITR